MHATPQQQYRDRIKELTIVLRKLEKRRSVLGWLRLAAFAVTVALSVTVFTAYGTIGLLPLLTGLAVLLYLVSLDVANNEGLKNTKNLLQINNEEERVLEHLFLDRDDGSRFQPAEHLYAGDLDLFGKASVYQWLNRSCTGQGQNLVAANLLQHQPVELVLLRQSAVKELAPMLAWRQQLQAFAVQTKLTVETEGRISRWAAEEEKHFSHAAWALGVNVYTLITVSSALAAGLGLIPGAVFLGLFLMFLLSAFVLGRGTAKPYFQLNGIVRQTAVLQNMIRWLESGSFAAAHLVHLQASLKNDTTPAGEEIRKLKIILDRFDLRGSFLGVLFLNPFLLWDVRQMMALNRWRKRNRSALPLWFTAIAEAELLHSLSTVHFNQPQWCFPSFASGDFLYQVTKLGHPLLPQTQRVVNDFHVQDKPKIGLVTGSNMGGKSTFLRSLGVNAVLARMGAPVCAASFRLSPFQLVSSMRITDNLAENTSTFYAELKKLRVVIELAKTRHPAFILLDEILRGTNSFDRHKGSVAFIRQLIKEEAVAVIATHDVELASLQEAYPLSVSNYHFDVTVEGEELFFDYKLKPGVCKSLNASLLMKKIGIEIQE